MQSPQLHCCGDLQSPKCALPQIRRRVQSGWGARRGGARGTPPPPRRVQWNHATSSSARERHRAVSALCKCSVSGRECVAAFIKRSTKDDSCFVHSGKRGPSLQEWALNWDSSCYFSSSMTLVLPLHGFKATVIPFPSFRRWTAMLSCKPRGPKKTMICPSFTSPLEDT